MTASTVHAGATFTLAELATRWGCSTTTAEAIVYGEGGFVERGYLELVGTDLRVTDRGVRVSRAIGELGL